MGEIRIHNRPFKAKVKDEKIPKKKKKGRKRKGRKKKKKKWITCNKDKG